MKMESGVKEVAIFGAASESFSKWVEIFERRNNCTFFGFPGAVVTFKNVFMYFVCPSQVGCYLPYKVCQGRVSGFFKTVRHCCIQRLSLINSYILRWMKFSLFFLTIYSVFSRSNRTHLAFVCSSYQSSFSRLYLNRTINLDTVLSVIFKLMLIPKSRFIFPK